MPLEEALVRNYVTREEAVDTSDLAREAAKQLQGVLAQVGTCDVRHVHTWLLHHAWLIASLSSGAGADRMRLLWARPGRM